MEAQKAVWACLGGSPKGERGGRGYIFNSEGAKREMAQGPAVEGWPRGSSLLCPTIAGSESVFSDRTRAVVKFSVSLSF